MGGGGGSNGTKSSYAGGIQAALRRCDTARFFLSSETELLLFRNKNVDIETKFETIVSAL